MTADESSLKLLLILQLALSGWCLFETCNHQLNLKAGGKLYINSPYYPAKYPSGSSCRYTVTAPARYQINFQCVLNFDAAPNRQCTTEIFYFNAEGSELISNSDYFCGSGTFERKSAVNQAVISYISSSNNSGGFFSCYVEVVAAPCDCGWSATPRVVGGVEADISEFPSMAGVVHLGYNRIFCGATLIHYRFLLSAAHCFAVERTRNVEDLVIIVGDLDLTEFDFFYTKMYAIENIITHPLFRIKNVQNDIALIQTVENILYEGGVGPACLPFRFQQYDFAGTTVETAGWGTTTFGGEQAERLMKTTLDVIATDVCKKAISTLAADQFCTFTPGKDTCQYDSGGGLYFKANRKFVTGIVSYGYACATNVPSVNTRVAAHLAWILNNTANVDFCKL